MSSRKRYAQVGVGGRSMSYTQAILERYAEHCELVALCDVNPGRLELRARYARQHGAGPGLYLPEEFDRMVSETRPDWVIVANRDAQHDAFICRAMELGCDAISEKPLTTDEVKCQRIIDAVRRTGRRCLVTFNMRYGPARRQLKKLLMAGTVGKVLSVEFRECLDFTHGAEYFRRWHRQKAFSGGLLVHKATHHFDYVNWLLSDLPETVFAMGARRFYIPEQARRYGLERPGERCLTCPEKDRCPFFFDISQDEEIRSLYLEQERYDGYFRDRCVFNSEIDIEDTASLIVRYRGGALLNYFLCAHMPWEGDYTAINGTEGRIEYTCRYTLCLRPDGKVPEGMHHQWERLEVYPLFAPPYALEPAHVDGAHYGADPLMMDDLFDPHAPPDPTMPRADYHAGAYSVLVGAAANRSIQSGQPVRIRDLVHDLDDPEFPPMPSGDGPIRVDRDGWRVVWR